MDNDVKLSVLMKKLCIIILLIVGCASHQVVKNAPDLDKAKLVVSKVEKCMNLKPHNVYIVKSPGLNAFTDGDSIYFTESMVRYFYFEEETLLFVTAR